MIIARHASLPRCPDSACDSIQGTFALFDTDVERLELPATASLIGWIGEAPLAFTRPRRCFTSSS